MDGEAERWREIEKEVEKEREKRKGVCVCVVSADTEERFTSARAVAPAGPHELPDKSRDVSRPTAGPAPGPRRIRVGEPGGRSLGPRDVSGACCKDVRGA